MVSSSLYFHQLVNLVLWQRGRERDEKVQIEVTAWKGATFVPSRSSSEVWRAYSYLRVYERIGSVEEECVDELDGVWMGV